MLSKNTVAAFVSFKRKYGSLVVGRWILTVHSNMRMSKTGEVACEKFKTHPKRWIHSIWFNVTHKTALSSSVWACGGFARSVSWLFSCFELARDSTFGRESLQRGHLLWKNCIQMQRNMQMKPWPESWASETRDLVIRPDCLFLPLGWLRGRICCYCCKNFYLATLDGEVKLFAWYLGWDKHLTLGYQHLISKENICSVVSFTT